MEADNDCGTFDYKYIEYLINGNNQLLRRVLDDAYGVVKEEIFAQNISNLQFDLSGDLKVLAMTVTMTTPPNSRQISLTNSQSFFLRNRR
ncbi:MAG: hypothetical protein HQL27_08600 [Candidatus Omnitrophica bacterium]|nr:hypothetical protein [Candidatus Omnitrophota bacterium]